MDLQELGRLFMPYKVQKAALKKQENRKKVHRQNAWNNACKMERMPTASCKYTQRQSIDRIRLYACGGTERDDTYGIRWPIQNSQPKRR